LVSLNNAGAKAMKALLPFLSLIVFASMLLAADTNSNKALYFPHEHVQKIEVADSAIPFEKKLTMNEHDAVILILPDHKAVSIWCYRPDRMAMLAEQETKSGLKTTHAEKPWIMPRMKWKELGNGSFQGDGLDSYIEFGGVTTRAGDYSDYTLYVGQLKVNIIEDLTATNALPVTVKVSRTNRQPQQDGAANGSQPIRSETNGTSSAAGSRR
jgi:hypothetical protein